MSENESQQLPTILQTIEARWRAAGADPLPGATAEEVAAFERTNNVRLPAVVRAFYAHANGMTDGAWDGDYVSFWPLARFYTVPVLALMAGHESDGGIAAVLPGAASYFVFADFLIDSHFYAVKLSPDPEASSPVVYIMGTDWQPVAPTFGEFLSRYATEPGWILFGWS